MDDETNNCPSCPRCRLRANLEAALATDAAEPAGVIADALVVALAALRELRHDHLDRQAIAAAVDELVGLVDLVEHIGTPAPGDDRAATTPPPAAEAAGWGDDEDEDDLYADPVFEHDGVMHPDPVVLRRRAVVAALREMHEDRGEEWGSTITPLITFLGNAVHTLAALTGERDGIAAMHDAAEHGAFDNATNALCSVWLMVGTLGEE
jgi:hypothetical protein